MSILMYGDGLPAELYAGDRKIAGYHNDERQLAAGATIEFNNTYNDFVSVSIEGVGTQESVPTPDSPLRLTASSGIINTFTEADTTTSETTITIPELRSISTLKDTLKTSNVKSNTYNLTRKIGCVVLDGSTLAASASNSYGSHGYYMFDINIPNTIANDPTAKCTHFKQNVAWQQNENYFYIDTNVIHVFTNQFSTLDAFNSFLQAQYAAENPVIVWYKLAEPTTETLQLGALKSNVFKTIVGGEAVADLNWPNVTISVKVSD